MEKSEHVSHASLTFTAENAETHHGDAIHQWALREKIKADNFREHEQQEYMQAVIKVARSSRILADKARMYAEVNQKKEESVQSAKEAQKRLEEMARKAGVNVDEIKRRKQKASGDSDLDQDEQDRLEKARKDLKKYFD